MNNNGIYKYLLIFVIVIILAIFISSRGSNSDKASLKLIGDNKIVLNQYERYYEYGYNVVNKSDNSGYYVNVNGKVNTDIVGVYNISYSLYNKNAVLLSTVTRKVMVVEDDLSNLDFVLHGNNVEYYFTDDYVDKGVEVYRDDKDISNEVIVNSNVIANQVGKYQVEYIIENNSTVRSITREVNIVDLEIKKEILKNNSSINLDINNINYDYTILPNGRVSYATKIIYNYAANDAKDNYEFDVYLKSGSHKKYIVEKRELAGDNTVGTCTLSFENNSTTITMKMQDESSVSRYSVNGLDFYTNTKTINGYYGNITVNVYNQSNVSRSIKCKNTMTSDFKTINSNKIGWIPYGGVSVTSESNELDAIVESYGLRTREAVVAAGTYLANYKYKMLYSWGGKYTKKGLNPKWGTRANYSSDPTRKCTKPLNSDHSSCELGLDCTGYTAWAFAQAGFSKDIIRESAQERSMWGSFNATKHTYKFSSSNLSLARQIKPGDIVSIPTEHVGLVIGVDYQNETIQVAHQVGGIQITIIKMKNGGSINSNRDFTHFTLFDDYYNTYGNK